MRNICNEDIVERFFRSIDIKQGSKVTYRRQLAVFLAWVRQANSTALIREDILEYKEYLTYDRELESLTISGYLTVVRRFFSWLEEQELYKDITRGIRGPRRRSGFRRDCLSKQQVQKLLTSIERHTLQGKRDFSLINLMVRTGLRTIEIARARRQDLVKQGAEMVLYVHGKGHDAADELVVLTPSTLVPIKDYFALRGRVRGEDPLFISHCSKNFGSSLTTRSISRIAKNRLRAIGIDDGRVSAHSLRHTAITLSLLAGATTEEARLMARHRDINTTLVYAHNLERLKDAPEKKIDMILDEI